MTRAQAIKTARERATTLRTPVTVVHDFAMGAYACIPGDCSIGELRQLNPSYVRVVVITPERAAA